MATKAKPRKITEFFGKKSCGREEAGIPQQGEVSVANTSPGNEAASDCGTDTEVDICASSSSE